MNKSKVAALSLTGILIIALAILGWVNRALIQAYIIDIKEHPYSKGDKLYAFKFFYMEGDHNELPLVRIIKSNHSSKHWFVRTGISISSDSLKKYKSSYLGDYLKRYFFYIKIKDTSGIIKFYAVKPNSKVLSIKRFGPDTLLKDYSYVDSNLYINYYVAVDKELNKY